jgi:hypothetical protein
VWVAAVLGLVALVAGAVVWMNLSGDDGPDERSTATAAGSTPSAAEPSAAPTDDTPGATAEPTGADSAETVAASPAAAAMEECVAALASADAVMEAARSGAANWAAHVESRTDLLAGRRDRDEVGAIWRRTRLAGPGDLEAFEAAYADYAAPGKACARVEDDQSPQAEACVARAGVAERAVRAAREVVDDWSEHQAAMAAHAAGDFDADHAQGLWEAAWEAAPPDIRAYRRAAAALADAPACAAR